MRHRMMALCLLLLMPVTGSAMTMDESKTGAGDGSSTTLALAAQNLASGSLNVACFKWENAVTLSTITDTATNVYTLLPEQIHSGASLRVRCGYVLSATSNASNVATATFSGNAIFRRGAVYEFTYTGTGQADGETGSTEDNADTTPSSNGLTTTGTDGACVAVHGDLTGLTFSSRTINGTAADGSDNMGNDTTTWYRTLSAPFENGTSSLTRSAGGSAWLQRMACFRAVTALSGCMLYQNGTDKVLLQAGTTSGMIYQGGGDCALGGGATVVPVRALIGVGL